MIMQVNESTGCIKDFNFGEVGHQVYPALLASFIGSSGIIISGNFVNFEWWSEGERKRFYNGSI